MSGGICLDVVNEAVRLLTVVKNDSDLYVGDTRTASHLRLTSLPVVQALRWTWSSHHDDHMALPDLFGWWHCHFTIKVNRMITKKWLFPFLAGHRQWWSVILLNLFDNIFSCNVALQCLIAYRTQTNVKLVWNQTKLNSEEKNASHQSAEEIFSPGPSKFYSYSRKGQTESKCFCLPQNPFSTALHTYNMNTDNDNTQLKH